MCKLVEVSLTHTLVPREKRDQFFPFLKKVFCIETVGLCLRFSLQSKVEVFSQCSL